MITKSVTVMCDICNETHDNAGYFTIKTARAMARQDDWVQRKSDGVTIDICDLCIEKEQQQS